MKSAGHSEEIFLAASVTSCITSPGISHTASNIFFPPLLGREELFNIYSAPFQSLLTSWVGPCHRLP